MDALWSLEDKWKLTTQEALLLFVCTAITVIGLCTATILKTKAQRKEIADREDGRGKWAEPSCNWVSIKRMLMGSVRWSGANKWEERAPPLLGLKEGYEGSVGWQSHNSDSPVWQRPILMGEKCELPRFSGLILYDESGKPVDHSLKETSPKPDIHQEKPVAVVRITLKDLL
ncbi:hypothetical protein Pint_04843 [Pistacia integerrima]|uniref:Uncharacterized protein n=1 Tax=Pistacia integerrima TaxID=434235 RepID=A0ACC0Z6F5_9ROSI|nr:hypothetical protein Pint_04843 [Pistacia integerrima]